MNETTKFIYENSIGTITFAYDSPFWLTEIDGVSSVNIDISESRSVRQVGSSIAEQSVQPKTIPLDGAIYEPLDANREKLLDVIAPQVNATLTVVQGGESWFLDVVPTKTPDVMPGNGEQYFQMELYAAYPYWRTTAAYASQIAGLIALFKFPFYTGGKWWISKYSDSYFNTIENKGNVPVEFTVVFTARSELVNPELYHVETKKWIRIRKTMIAGERISVSTKYGERGVVAISANGVVTNGFRLLAFGSSLDMALTPGENLLRIDAAQNREGLSVRIEAPEGVKSGV